jgi:hypothetical protein
MTAHFLDVDVLKHVMWRRTLLLLIPFGDRLIKMEINTADTGCRPAPHVRINIFSKFTYIGKNFPFRIFEALHPWQHRRTSRSVHEERDEPAVQSHYRRIKGYGLNWGMGSAGLEETQCRGQP